MKIVVQTIGIETTFVAKLDDNIIGKCIVRPRQGTFSYMKKTRARFDNAFSDKHIYISWLGVNSEYQGQYVGTRLLYSVLKHYSRKGFRYVTLMNASARENKPDSIYNQIGMTYIPGSDGKNSDYMIGNIRHMLHGKFGGMNGVNIDSNKFYRSKAIIPSI